VHLQIILEVLHTKKHFAKLSKCSFATSQVSYLGNIILAKVVVLDPKKVIAIHNWPHPRSLTKLRGFLNLTGFYRKFVYHYTTLVTPLTDLLRNQKFTWSVSTQEAFEELKLQISQVLTLHLQNFSLPFVVEKTHLQ